jgi:hypothetical protein
VVICDAMKDKGCVAWRLYALLPVEAFRDLIEEAPSTGHP